MGTNPLSPTNNQSFMNLGKPTTGNTGQPGLGSAGLGPVYNQGFTWNPNAPSSGPGSVPAGTGGGIISGGLGNPTLGHPGAGWGPNAGSGIYGYGNNPYIPATPYGNSPLSPTYGTSSGGAPITTNPVTNPQTPYAGLLQSGGTVGGYSGTGTQPQPSPYGNLGSAQQQTLANQLGKIYGVGTGALLSSTLANLGSADNSYMQAYAAAMQPIAMQNQNTMMTTMGNQGIGGNSSTSALAQGDFWSNVTSQEGLQEAGLQLQSQNNLLELEKLIAPQSAAERQQGGFLNYLGQALGGVGNTVSQLSGGQGLGGLKNLFNPSSASSAMTDASASDAAIFGTDAAAGIDAATTGIGAADAASSVGALADVVAFV